MDSAAVLSSRDQIPMLSSLPFAVRQVTPVIQPKVANIASYNFASVSSECLEMYRKALLEQIPSFDVCIIQHIFSNKQKDNELWIQSLRNKGFYVASTICKSVWNASDHGLAIVSKMPIISQNTMSLKKGLLGDRYQSKAGLYAKLKMSDDRSLHVFSFDLKTLKQYSIAKDKQFQAMKQFVNVCIKDMARTDCIVSGGDFGIDHPEDLNEMNQHLRTDNTSRGGDLNKSLVLQDVLKLKGLTDNKLLSNRLLVGNATYQMSDERFAVDTSMMGSHNFCGVDGVTVRVMHQ